jgi:hypothetical protein
MARPRPISLVAAILAFAAVLAFLRRGAGRRRERVDVYYDDGSMISLADGQAHRLLDIARTVL